MPLYPPELQQRYFEAAAESPGAWLISAMSLKAAANRLDWKTNPVQEHEATVSFIAEYRMLIGLSLENIIKGLITLVRLEQALNPILPKECFNHRLHELASRPELAEFSIRDEEISLLEELSHYVEWRGRYPTAKKVSQQGFTTHGSQEHESEINLYEKLALPLLERGWLMKGGPASMGGFKLKLQNNETDQT